MSALLLVRVVRALLHQTDAQQREIAKLKSQVSALHTLLGQSRQTAVNAEARAEETADQASKHASSLRRAQNQLSEWERHFGGLVEFKSEAQRRIQLASRDLLNHPSFRKEKRRNLEEAAKLLAKMKRGEQALADFQCEGTLWGYTKHKFGVRALEVATGLWTAAQAWSPLHTAAASGKLRSVCSVGGGPASEIFGFLLFRDSMQSGSVGDGSSAPRHYCLDYAPNWAPIVRHLASTVGEHIEFAHCDVSLPLSSPDNAPVMQACKVVDAFLFCM